MATPQISISFTLIALLGCSLDDWWDFVFSFDGDSDEDWVKSKDSAWAKAGIRMRQELQNVVAYQE